VRLPRFRFTVSRLMAAVAIAAVALGLAARSREFRRIAARHSIIACAGPGTTPEQARRLERRNVYNAALWPGFVAVRQLPEYEGVAHPSCWRIG
jgi:hypothetical protein